MRFALRVLSDFSYPERVSDVLNWLYKIVVEYGVKIAVIAKSISNEYKRVPSGNPCGSLCVF